MVRCLGPGSLIWEIPVYGQTEVGLRLPTTPYSVSEPAPQLRHVERRPFGTLSGPHVSLSGTWSSWLADHRRAWMHDHIEAGEGMLRDLQGGIQSEKAGFAPWPDSRLGRWFGVVEWHRSVRLSAQYGDRHHQQRDIQFEPSQNVVFTKAPRSIWEIPDNTLSEWCSC